ncbi:MAG: hypothetical protein NVSMB46_03580 [Candidatus Saccharimonadales bacterium]
MDFELLHKLMPDVQQESQERYLFKLKQIELDKKQTELEERLGIVRSHLTDIYSIYEDHEITIAHVNPVINHESSQPGGTVYARIRPEATLTVKKSKNYSLLYTFEPEASDLPGIDEEIVITIGNESTMYETEDDSDSYKEQHDEQRAQVESRPMGYYLDYYEQLINRTKEYADNYLPRREEQILALEKSIPIIYVALSDTALNPWAEKVRNAAAERLVTAVFEEKENNTVQRVHHQKSTRPIGLHKRRIIFDGKSKKGIM